MSRRLSGDRGDTLVELLVTVTLLATAVSAVVGLVSSNLAGAGSAATTTARLALAVAASEEIEHQGFRPACGSPDLSALAVPAKFSVTVSPTVLDLRTGVACDPVTTTVEVFTVTVTSPDSHVTRLPVSVRISS